MIIKMSGPLKSVSPAPRTAPTRMPGALPRLLMTYCAATHTHALRRQSIHLGRRGDLLFVALCSGGPRPRMDLEGIDAGAGLPLNLMSQMAGGHFALGL